MIVAAELVPRKARMNESAAGQLFVSLSYSTFLSPCLASKLAIILSRLPFSGKKRLSKSFKSPSLYRLYLTPREIVLTKWSANSENGERRRAMPLPSGVPTHQRHAATRLSNQTKNWAQNGSKISCAENDKGDPVSTTSKQGYSL